MCDILVVDDYAPQRLAAVQRLRGLGYRVGSVVDTDALWHFLSRHTVRVILLDVILPDREGTGLDRDGGFKVARELAKRYPNIPIVILTARVGPFPDVPTVDMPTVSAIFSKPAPGTLLRQAIERAIRGSADD